MIGIIRLFTVAALCTLTVTCTTSQKIVGNKTGEVAPDISATDTNGKTITLSSLRGKVVLLEFWGSDNATCRSNHSEIQRLYEKYDNTAFESGKGLTVYSFSLDSQKDKWVQAIRTDQTTWPNHVCDFKSWNSKAALDYQLATTPKYYLIDGQGVIIRRNILIRDLEGILSDYVR